MILIVTNREDYTADFAILEMQRRGTPYFRFNTEDFPRSIAATVRPGASGLEGYFRTPKGTFGLDEISSVWFRRPVLPVPAGELDDGIVRQFCAMESLECLEGVWRGLDCHWVSKPDSIRTAESKVLQLTVASGLGLPIPRSLVTSDPREARMFFENTDRVVYKPLRQARLEYADRTALIFTTVVTDVEAERFGTVKYAPCLFQEYIPKAADVRVTAFGRELFATEIRLGTGEGLTGDWRRYDASSLAYSPHVLPPEVEEKCLRVLQRLDLAFGAIDMILTPEGEYVFLEINPNGQWAWIEQRTGMGMSRSLVDLLTRGKW